MPSGPRTKQKQKLTYKTKTIPLLKKKKNSLLRKKTVKIKNTP
jgi:hypothetical protein